MINQPGSGGYNPSGAVLAGTWTSGSGNVDTQASVILNHPISHPPYTLVALGDVAHLDRGAGPQVSVRESRRLAPRRVRIFFSEDVTATPELPPGHKLTERTPRLWRLTVTGRSAGSQLEATQ